MGVVVNINHETGNLTQYDASSVGSPAHLTVAAAAALAGTNYGLSFQIADTTNHYARKDVTASTTGKLRLRFYFDPNSITMGNSEVIYLSYCSANAGTQYVLSCRLYYAIATGYHISVGIYDDTAAVLSTAEYTITDAPHYIEIYLQRATNSTSSDGSIQLWIDGVSKGTRTGVDNYDRFNAFIRFFVCCVGLGAGTSGTYYLDEIIINDDGSEIGPIATTWGQLLSNLANRAIVGES